MIRMTFFSHNRSDTDTGISILLGLICILKINLKMVWIVYGLSFIAEIVVVYRIDQGFSK